jgi:sugar phosphate permease
MRVASPQLDLDKGADVLQKDPLIQRVQWRLMPLIMLCYFFAFFDRINIGFVKTQLQLDLHLSNAAYGVGASLFVVGYVLLEVPSNIMLYRVGARRWISRIMISWGIATAAMSLVTSPTAFYALRFLVGAMEAGFAPGVLFYLAQWFPASHRGRVTSLLFLSSALSGVLGGPIAGQLLTHLDGVGGLAGWRWLFLSGGLPCIGLGMLVYRRLDSSIEEAGWLGSSERARLRRDVDASNPAPTQKMTVAESLRSPGVLTLGVIYFLIQVGSYGLNFWGPDLIRSASGGSPVLVGFLSAGPYLCGAICMLILGRRADRSGNRVPFVVGCLIAAAAGFLIGGMFSNDAVILFIALCLVGAGIVAAIPSFWALPPKLVSGAAAASGIALINTIGQFGGIVSPIMVGHIKDATGDSSAALYVIAAFCLLAAAILAIKPPALLREKG